MVNIQTLSSMLVGSLVISVGLSARAKAAGFSPLPRYDTINRIETSIPNPGGIPDAADIYYPQGAPPLPAALLLQGSFVDKAEYSNFSRQVASYGFAVVVPNHVRQLRDPVTQDTFTGLFPEQAQVTYTLDYLKTQATEPTSVLAGRIDPNQLVILGHSFGGSVGLAALGGECVPFLCTASYERPAEVLGGVVYGSRFSDPRAGNVIPSLDNDGLPVGLIAGSRDGTTPLSVVEESYERVEDPPKALVTVLGANHYGITNTDIKLPPPPLGSGDFRDPMRPALDQAIATETIARWTSLFLQGTALSDPQAAAYVFGAGPALDPNVTVISELPSSSQSVPEPGVLGALIGMGGILWAMQRRK